MSLQRKSIKVAVVQGRTAFSCNDEAVAEAARLTVATTGDGAELVCFGETWMGGYPAWLDYCPNAARWNDPDVKEVFAALRERSISISGGQVRTLAQLAADCKVTLVMGINERVESGPGNGTLYNSILTFSHEGKLINHHRKLVPTFSERMVWGQGDGRGLRAVESGGVRVGALICWEHMMPLARQVMHNSGEHIHIAAWPGVHEIHQIASRYYAVEGRCFVLAAGHIILAADLPAQLTRPDSLKDPTALVTRGGSAIIAPDGRYVAGPVYGQETVLTAELDLREIERERMTLDVSGHYARPDLFHLAYTPWDDAPKE